MKEECQGQKKVGGRLNQTRVDISDGEHFSVKIFRH